MFFVGRNIYNSTRSPEEVAAQAYAAVEKVKDKPKNAAKNGGFVISKNGVNKPLLIFQPSMIIWIIFALLAVPCIVQQEKP